MARESQRKRRSIARVSFRANLETIRTELDQGWPAKAVFDRHIAGLDVMSYRQFSRYVRQLKDGSGFEEATNVVGATTGNTAASPSPLAASSNAPHRSATPHGSEVQAPQPPAFDAANPSRAASDQPRQFVWNPLPNKDDLI